MSFRSIITKHFLTLIFMPLLFVGLYLTSLYSYILFHIVAESFSIVIAICLFMIAWNTRHLTKNNYVLFISIAFLFAGIIDFVHTLAYKGMGVFIGFDANLPTQLWIIARYLQSISLLVAPWFIDRKLRTSAVFGFYLSATLLLLAAVFSGTLFPDCFIEGKGLTPFKVASEYIICFILISSFILLYRHREKFDPKILRLIAWSIFCTIVSELAFTFYISVYGLSNLIGHFFKIFSFYLIYRAIIATGLENPYSLLFYDLHKNQEEMEIILDSSPIMIFYKDSKNRFLRVNKVLAEATGLPREAMEGKTVFEIYPNQATSYWEDDKDVIASGKPKIGIIEPIDTATGTRWVQTDKIPYRDKEGRIIGIIGFAIDITERKRVDQELRDSEESFRMLYASSPIGIEIYDMSGRLLRANSATLEIFGLASEDPIKGFDLFSDPNISDDHKAMINRGETIKYNASFDFEKVRELALYPTTKRGIIELDLVIQPLASGGGYQVLVQDVTARKQAEKALQESEERYRELSIVDDLTQLYNSRHFYFQLKIELERSNRYEQPLTLLLMDIDNFKAFNDTYGHIEGDHVLRRLGQVVKRCLRETDLAYRYGGEEFTILLPMTTSEDGAVTAERIRTEFKKENFSPAPCQEIHLTVSIGLAQYKPQEDMKTFVHRVDQLMYQAKKNGKNRVCSEA